MFLRYLVLTILAILFGTIIAALYRQLKKYGSIGNIFKSDKLKTGSYWLTIGASPFGNTLAIRIHDLKDNYVKFETSPGEFDSLPIPEFLSTHNNVTDDTYKYPNAHEIWKKKSDNPFTETKLANVTEVKKGWVKFTIENKDDEQTSPIIEFIAEYSFQDFSILQSHPIHTQTNQNTSPLPQQGINS